MGSLSLPAVQRGEESPHSPLMAYKYQYNPAATDNVSLHDTARGRTAGSLTYRSSARIRQTEEEQKASLATKCCFGFIYVIAQIFLHAPVALILFWIIQYKALNNKPFAWRVSALDDPQTDPPEDPEEYLKDLELTWNLHPLLMVTGFIYFVGQGMLVYRTCSCCPRLVSKILHAGLYLLAVPCIVLGFLAVFNWKTFRTTLDRAADPRFHFYSIHSWLGLAAIATFSLQLLLGLFSFLLLLAVSSAVCGLTEKALFIGRDYIKWTDVVQNLTPWTDFSNEQQQSLILNVTAASLGVLAVLMTILLWYPKFRFRSSRA